jgi:hypothetical protein
MCVRENTAVFVGFCMDVCLCVCVCVCVCLCVCVCVCVFRKSAYMNQVARLQTGIIHRDSPCMYICACMRYACIYMRLYVSLRERDSVRVRVFVFVCMYVHTYCVYLCICIFMYVFMHACMYLSSMYVCMHTESACA